MRSFLWIVPLALTACATGRDHVGYCAVLSYAGAKGEPFGLVDLDEELETRLRNQLPDNRSDDYICWYATGTEILAADRQGKTAIYGTVFRRQGAEWRLADDEESLLLRLPPDGF